MSLDDDLEMTKRHVEIGERTLMRQHDIIAEMQRKGLSSDDALRFLHLLEDIQSLHREHLSRLLRQASDKPT